MAGPNPPRPHLLELLAGLADSPRVHTDVAEAIRVLDEMSTDRSTTLLSILVLVSRDRLEALKDTLLCLHAQPVRDFEVVLVRHALPTEELGEVEQVVADQPEELRAVIRTVDQSEGSRAAALDAAVEIASGSYVVACEAGDLFLTTWASTLQTTAAGTAARVIHSLGAAQGVVPVLWPTDEEGFHAATPVTVEGQEYDAVEHLHHRPSPPPTWAIPRWLFRGFGLGFSDAGGPLLDWEVVHRACALAGVLETGTVTSVSRTWLTARSWEAVEAAPETSVAPADVHRLEGALLSYAPGSLSRRARGIGASTSPRVHDPVQQRRPVRRGGPLRTVTARVAGITWARKWRRG